MPISKNIAYFNSNSEVRYLCFGEVQSITFKEQIDFDALQAFLDQNQQRFLYGYITYDAKNSIELLKSENKDFINAPTLHFSVPSVAVKLNDSKIEFIQGQDSPENRDAVSTILNDLQKPNDEIANPLNPRIDKATYLTNVEQLKAHIQQGNIYEINFCQEYFSENNNLTAPMAMYAKINDLTKAPFSVYLQHENLHVMCGSPERFIEKKANKIISQPIKGTAPRGRNKEEDDVIKLDLANNPKEISENVMIVDLVRNDLSKIAAKGTVKVDELFGIYTFPTVHQMISTISCELKESVNFSEIIKATFPMGSMTGAPKVSAMQLSEEFESFRRGIYAGTIGYILPNGDFDFNVVIRSIIYNSENGYLSCGVGGAITINSDPEKEFEECQTKVSKLLNAVSN